MRKYQFQHATSRHGLTTLLGFSLCASIAAHAASPAQWAQCGKFDDAGFAACTRIIQAKQEPLGERVKAHVKRAWHYHFREDNARATGDLEAAIKLAPGRPETYDDWAWMFNDNPEVAIVSLSRAIELQDSPYRRQQRGGAHRRQGDDVKATEDYARALELINIEIAKGAPYAYLFKQRSDIERELGAIDAALADFNEYLKRKAPSDAPYLEDRASLHLQKAAFDEALADIGDPKDDFGRWERRALVLRVRGDFEGAIREYDRILQSYIGYETHLGRGLAYAGLGRFNRAIVDFTKAIDLYPESAEAHYNRAQAAREDGHADVAIADYTKAIELDPRNAAFYNSRGRAYEKLGDMSRAAADFDKAIETDPGFAAAYSNRGHLLKASDKLEEAIANFSKAIEADRDNKTFLYARAQALAEQGKNANAIRDYDLALRMDPTDPLVYLGRAQARSALARLSEALDDANRALLVDGKLPSGYAIRSAIYARLGDAKNAEADKKRMAAASAAMDEEKKRRRAKPRDVRVTIVGKFSVVPDYLPPFELRTAIEVRGDKISYQTPGMPLYTMQSGETFEEKFFGACSGQTTTNQGERFVTASLDGDLLHIQLRSRLDFTTGACRGRHNYYSETFLIDLHGGKCKFDYLQTRDLFNVGEFGNRIADQACAVADIQ